MAEKRNEWRVGYDHFVGRGEKKRKKNKSDGRNGGQLRRSNDLQDSWSLLNFYFFFRGECRRKEQKRSGGGWLKQETARGSKSERRLSKIDKKK